MRKWQSAINPMVGGGSVVREGNQVIAFVPRLRSYDGFEISGSDITNARLIAAAPELLEALKLCVEVLSKIGSGDPIDKARQVIHKAEGKQNETR